MKKATKWIKRILISLVITIAVSPFLLEGFAILCFKGLEIERNALNDPAEHVLQELGVATAEEATWYDMTIDGVITMFEVSPLVLDGTEDWHNVSVSTSEYIHQVKTLAPEADFLLPAADTVFDMQRDATPTQTTWYDVDSELLIHLNLQKSPSSGRIKLDTFSVPHNGYVYELETHGGFFGDGTTYQALIVPEAERPALEDTLAAHADWHEGSITHAEYVTLHDREFYEVPQLYPAVDVTFDWWCYVDTFARNNPDFESSYIPDSCNFPAVMRENGARPSGNWLVALYDADTGLFIFYQYDS